MQNTPTVGGSHSSTILITLKKISKSINVNTFFKSSDLDPNSRTNMCLPARTPARSVAIVFSKKSIKIGGKRVL
jgi:hypothetical protein